MNGVSGAYLATLTVIGFRWYKVGQPPPPYNLLGATGIYAACGLIANANAKFGTVLAWSFFAGEIVAAFTPGSGLNNIAPVNWWLGTAPASATKIPIGPGTTNNDTSRLSKNTINQKLNSSLP